MHQTLRRSGGSLVMTIPKAFVEQNRLTEGSKVALTLRGSQMTVVKIQKPRYSLDELMAEMKDGFPMVEGWDKQPPVGKEKV